MPEAAIPEALSEMLDHYAQAIGASTNHVIREAILRYLDDLEDLRIATERLKNPGKRIPFEEIRKQHKL